MAAMLFVVIIWQSLDTQHTQRVHAKVVVISSCDARKISREEMSSAYSETATLGDCPVAADTCTRNENNRCWCYYANTVCCCFVWGYKYVM